MKINDASRATGVSRDMIRFYEKQGLVCPARLPNGYRDYSDDDLYLLTVIRYLSNLGVPLRVISKAFESGETDLLVGNLKDEISRLKGQVAAKNAEVEAMKQRIVEVSKLVETIYDGGGMEYERHASAPAKASYSEVETDLTGHIVKLDAQFGYAVIDLNRSRVINGLKLGVYHNGAFLGLLKVIEAGEFNSLAVVVGGKAADMAVGDTLVVASAALQDSKVTGK